MNDHLSRKGSPPLLDRTKKLLRRHGINARPVDLSGWRDETHPSLDERIAGAFEDVDLSAMARSFYAENKRVSNTLLTSGFGYRLRYPTYREGLAALSEAQ